jgi:hypothetical protein
VPVSLMLHTRALLAVCPASGKWVRLLGLLEGCADLNSLAGMLLLLRLAT